MKPTDNYAYSFDNERYYEQCDSIEEALAAAKIDAKNDDEFKDAKTVYIGRVYKFVPEVDAWAVLENLWDDAYEETEETIDSIDYLSNVSDDDTNKLGKMLTETFNKWARETDNEPNFFVVKDVKEYSLEDGNEL
ncbi:MAG: hypothetical protein ACI3WT_07930 [Phascolarctobacterium sp.]